MNSHEAEVRAQLADELHEAEVRCALKIEDKIWASSRGHLACMDMAAEDGIPEPELSRGIAGYIFDGEFWTFAQLLEQRLVS